MAVQDIAYVDHYAKDKQAVVELFTAAMGFSPIADCVGPESSSILLAQGTARIAVTSGPAIWKFLDQHGDGVAEIALVCEDVEATRAAALRAGADDRGRVHGLPAVSAFGDVIHTLLPARSGPQGPDPLPAAGPGPGRRWTAREPLRPGRVRNLDHVAVCVEGGRLAEVADFYRAAFGLEHSSSQYVALGGQAMDSIVMSSASRQVIFTLVAPVPGTEPGQLDEFLGRNGGTGVQHLAFGVDDIFAAAEDWRAGGVQFLTAPDRYYDNLIERLGSVELEVEELRPASVLADRDEWGLLLQLFSRSPYERNTLFYELIQRRGSRGFGTNNFKALYEAVDRDRLAAE